MTAPTGTGDINLAALWVPIMPETSHMREGGRKAGEELMAGFREGVGSGGASLGQTLGSQLSSGFKSGMGNLELPGGLTNLTEGVMRGFEGMSTRSENARAAFERLKQSEEQLVNSHNRVAVAQSRLNDLQQRGVTSGTQYLSASSGLISAKQREESSLRSASEAHEGYQQALTSSRGGMMAFAAETGILAGAVAGAIPLIGMMIEGVIDFWKEAAEKGVEVSIEFAKHLLEIGEEYHALGIQIQEFSTVSGEALEDMEAAAARVFSSLDVSGSDTGQVMAMLSSRLKTTDTEALVPLTRHVEELHGRFNDLNPQDVATAFAALRVGIGDADNVLAAWLQSARSAGVDTGQLVNSLARVGEMLRPEVTGLSAEQLGEWVARMQAVVPNISRTVTALNSAEKEFVAHNMTFREGIQEAIKELNSAATEADKEELAEKLFGTRRWSVALDMLKQYEDILAKGPDAYRANGSGIDDFTKKTQDFGNKWEEVKKKIGEALLPLGTDLLTHVSGGLDKLNNYLQTHSVQIAQWVKNIGDSFIRLLPTLQQWTVDILEILKPVIQGVQMWGADLLMEVGLVSQSMATAMDLIPGPLAKLIPGFDEAKKAAHGMADSTLGMSKQMMAAVDPTGRFFDGIIGKVKDLHIDVPGLTKDFDNLSDSLGRKLGESAEHGINGMKPWWTSGGGGGLSGAGGGAAGGEPAAPGGPPSTPGGAPGGGATQPNPSMPGYNGPPIPGVTMPPGAPGARPSGVQTPAQQGVYRAMVEAGFPNSWSAIQNIVSGEDASWNVTATNTTDSNAVAGNPSRGIGQLTLSNYRAAGVDPYTNDAYQQGRAMMSYIKGRYGTPEAAWQHWQISHNYQHGGFAEFTGIDTDKQGIYHGHIYNKTGDDDWIKHYIDVYQQWMLGPGTSGMDPGVAQPKSHAAGNFVTGGRGQVDDVPAWLTAGEFVVNKRAATMFAPVLKWMNARGYAPGGPVAPGGDRTPGLPQLNTQGAQVDTIAVAEAVAKVFGITDIGMYRGADQFHEHSSGEAADVMVGLNNPIGNSVKDFAMMNAANFGVQYAIWQNQMWYPGKAPTPYGSTGSNTDKHLDHVHIATAGGGFPQGGGPGADFSKGLPTSHPTSNTPAPGVSTVMAGMGMGGASIPGSSSGGSVGPGGPGMAPPGSGIGAPPIGSPATTAGYGPYGMESYDQWYQANKSITGAQNRLDDLTRSISDKQKQLDQANAELTKLQAQPGLLQNDQQIQSKTAERDRLQEELTKIRNQELPDATGALSEAQRKAWEDAQKMPGGQQEYQVPGVSAFTQLGGGLVKGASQELGFGEIFGKPPWEWGIVKLMSGLANWGLGTANAWAEEIGKGHTGMTGFQPVAGMEQSGSAGLEGVLKGFGMNVALPKPQQVDRFGRPVGTYTGPNVAPGPAPGAPGSPGPGNGPVIQGDYMPINVSPNVNPSAVMGPVQAQRNADNASSFQFSGGMPPS